MSDFIEIVGARQNNLKNINIKIPKNKLVVITGMSGSGKSSLAFDTIYAEGQRRYMESFSLYARQFLDIQNKPDVDSITGLSPAIAIDQKVIGRSPRSTVGTITEIYDYLKLLYSKIGVPYSSKTGKPLQSLSAEQIVDALLQFPEGTKISILISVVRNSRGEHRDELIKIRKNNYLTIKVDGNIYDIRNILPKLDKATKHNIDIIFSTIVISETNKNAIFDMVKNAIDKSNGVILIDLISFPDGVKTIKYKDKDLKVNEQIKFAVKYYDPDTGLTIDTIEPKLFSFNNPFGACPKCDGLGIESFFDPDLIVLDKNLSIKDGAIDFWRSKRNEKQYIQMVEKLGQIYNFSIDTPYYQYSDEIKNIILYGTDDEIELIQETNLATHKIKVKFQGAMNMLLEDYAKNKDNESSNELSKYQSLKPCSECGGHRLNKEALSIKIDGINISEMCNLSILELIQFFDKLSKKLDKHEKIIVDRIVDEIKSRLDFLINVGLEYLTLSRESSTLSGGESQRIRLATQISAGLSGVIYVLDEPSIGLHQSDNYKLIDTLKKLRDLGNTVIVVEHDEDTMLAADWLIDIGPCAGVKGGYVLAEGKPEDVINNPNSITGLYLRGIKTIPIPSQRRQFKKERSIKIYGAQGHNLKNINVEFPTGVFCSVTGVSGSGKSTLVLHTLYKILAKVLNRSSVVPEKYDRVEGTQFVDKIIRIDQTPIGRTPRSNPCTYIGAFTYIRDLFVDTPDAINNNYKVNMFSFNVKGGRCENCQGDGMVKIEMHFMSDIYITCPVCNGQRYNTDILNIKYKGKSIADVLNMTVDEACVFFKDISYIYDKFKSLRDVGLGYIKIGQSSTTLSGGEAQRIKLAKELAKRDTGSTVYILDEPTTGLHFDDIKKLLFVLHKLVEQGNTVIVIEHNLDVVKTSDWVIDIGPYGGNKGGEVIAVGTPEDICKNKNSITGKFLKELMDRYYKNLEKIKNNE